MELQSLTPNLMVKDVNKTLEYYTSILGFEVLQTVPEKGVFDWGFVQKDQVKLMIQKENSIQSEYPHLTACEKGGALTFYIKVKDLQSWYKSIQNKVNVIQPMHQTFYGANEFAILDLNGFTLVFSDLLE